MKPRIPILSTLIVAAAIATMIGLGVWQLQRMAWKEDLISRYARAETMSSAVPWPRDAAAQEEALFRASQVYCTKVIAIDAVAGHNIRGVTGWAQTARCALREGGEADIALGWSSSPSAPLWSGGEVIGFIVPGAGKDIRLIASPPLAGLAPLQRAHPDSIPNNHFAYAIQWFLFAGVAAGIYGIALRKRLAAGNPPR